MTKKNIVSVISMAVIFIFASTLAFFGSTDAVTNRLQASDSLKISIVEDNYTDRQIIAYEQAITKNPKIKNIDKTDAVVFMKVTVPTVTASAEQKVTLIAPNGSIEYQLANNETIGLFHYLTSDTPEDTITDGGITVNQVIDEENITNTYGKTKFQYNQNWILLKHETGSNTYLFGYQYRVNSGDITATALFDKIQYKSILEHNIPNGTPEYINIEAYAVQADYISVDGNTVTVPENKEGAVGLTDEQLGKIFDTYVK